MVNNVWLNSNDSDVELVTGTPGSVVSVIPSLTHLKPWSGARATLGAHKGKYWWSCRIEALSGPAAGLRVGWSTLKSSLQLGQDPNGFAYDLQGLCWTNGKSEPFGEALTVGDEIGCFLSFQQQTISFSKNGFFLGSAFRIPSDLNGHSFFPHVLIRGDTKVRVFFSSAPDHPRCPLSGFKTLQEAVAEHTVSGVGVGSEADEETNEVLVGVAGAGKTSWAKEQQEKDFNKNWLILSPLTCLEQAHVDVEGELELLKAHPLSKVREMFKSSEQEYVQLLRLAAQKNRNIIIDSRHIYADQRRALTQTFNTKIGKNGKKRFTCKAVVFTPGHTELRRRQLQKQRKYRLETDVSNVDPTSSSFEVRMTVPTKAEGFEEVLLIKDINVDATTSDSTANKHEESFGPLKDRQALEGATPSTARRAALKTPPKLFPRPYRGQKLESTARPSPTYSEENIPPTERKTDFSFASAVGGQGGPTVMRHSASYRHSPYPTAQQDKVSWASAKESTTRVNPSAVQPQQPTHETRNASNPTPATPTRPFGSYASSLASPNLSGAFSRMSTATLKPTSMPFQPRGPAVQQQQAQQPQQPQQPLKQPQHHQLPPFYPLQTISHNLRVQPQAAKPIHQHQPLMVHYQQPQQYAPQPYQNYPTMPVYYQPPTVMTGARRQWTH